MLMWGLSSWLVVRHAVNAVAVFRVRRRIIAPMAA
jgi:hypothetical protein